MSSNRLAKTRLVDLIKGLVVSLGSKAFTISSDKLEAKETQDRVTFSKNLKSSLEDKVAKEDHNKEVQEKRAKQKTYFLLLKSILWTQ